MSLEPRTVAVLAALAAALVVLVLLALVVSLSQRSRSLSRLGYVRRADGSWTRVVGEVEVAYRKSGRWTVRTGFYAATDFLAEPRDDRGEDPGHSFASGDHDLDARLRFWSERPPFAKQLLTRSAVVEAILGFPQETRFALRGDELVVEGRPGTWKNHERVVSLARAIAASARPS